MDYQSIPQMIQNGQFGVSSPIQQTAYNPYNNMMPLNASYQQQPTNNFVFQPIDYGYQPQQQNYYNPYGRLQQNYYDPYGQQQNYYDPYGQQQNYYNPYGQQQNYYNPYGQPQTIYNPMIMMQQIEQANSQRLAVLKAKYRVAAAYSGKNITEEELDRMLNPQNKSNIPSEAESAAIRDHQAMVALYNSFEHAAYYESAFDRQTRIMQEYSANYHKEFDNHSLAQFLDEDLWKLQREDWIRKNINRSASRNLKNTYNSNDYNELLELHRSSNPYVRDLLNNSRYDNNIDDLELGMDFVRAKQQRALSVRNMEIPSISMVSSKETQERRAAFSNSIMNIIKSNKGLSIVV